MIEHLRNWMTGLPLVVFSLLVSACGGGGGGSAPGPSPPVIVFDGEWLVPQSDVVDGGPGVEGIPAVDTPVFEPVSNNQWLEPDDLVVGIRIGNELRAYPHIILDWHEVVNDSAGTSDFTLSYCPLTGSAVAWDTSSSAADPTFGVSGLLYNSNLIMIDRQTGSLWSQMLEQSIHGPRIRELPERIQVIETSWGTWRQMFPGSVVLTLDTGHSRSYGVYPYGNYRTNRGLLFPVTHEDERLHRKTRVVGMRDGDQTKVFQIDSFGDTMNVLNEQVGSQSIVVIGNSLQNIGAIYNRQLSDGTILNFTAIDGSLPNVMQDDEGNVWDIFGAAVSGPRVGAQLDMTSSYIAMWFAWVAFFPDAEIHFN